MKDRHELYAKFGIAAEAAQLFETELGTLLLALRGLENGWNVIPDGQAALKVVNDIDRSTLGRMLKNLKPHIYFEDGMENLFESALEARNRLTHGFFEKHNFKVQTEEGRKAMISDLDRLHGKLFKAWQLASRLTSHSVSIVRHREQSGQEDS